jgi:hypothetical protein
MANIAATPHWDEIRRLAELGVPLSKLAEDYGLNPNTVWSQATRNDWLLPRRVRSKMAEVEAKNAQSRKTSLFGGKDMSEIGERAFIETLEDKREYLSTLSYEAAVEAMEKSKGQMIAEKPSEFKALVHVARQALGMDTEAPAIQLSLFAGAPEMGPRIMDITDCTPDALQQDTELSGFWE